MGEPPVTAYENTQLLGPLPTYLFESGTEPLDEVRVLPQMISMATHKHQTLLLQLGSKYRVVSPRRGGQGLLTLVLLEKRIRSTMALYQTTVTFLNSS